MSDKNNARILEIAKRSLAKLAAEPVPLPKPRTEEERMAAEMAGKIHQHLIDKGWIR